MNFRLKYVEKRNKDNGLCCVVGGGSKLGIGETRTIRVKNGICQLAPTGGKFDLKEKELEQNDHFNHTKSFWTTINIQNYYKSIKPSNFWYQ